MTASDFSLYLAAWRCSFFGSALRRFCIPDDLPIFYSRGLETARLSFRLCSGFSFVQTGSVPTLQRSPDILSEIVFPPISLFIQILFGCQYNSARVLCVFFYNDQKMFCFLCIFTSYCSLFDSELTFFWSFIIIYKCYVMVFTW